MERPYSIEYPEASGPPQLTTFYSFKGGVGRTQSLYNVGVRLAALRRKVMMVDVDLEAPGLSIGALDDRERNSKDGFAEIASDLLLELEVTIEEGDPDLFAEVVSDYQTRLDRALHVIDVPMPPRQEDLAERLRDEMGVTKADLPTGSLALLSSGRIDPDYPQKMIDVEIDKAFQKDLTDEQHAQLPALLDAAGLDLPGVPDNLGLVFTAVLRSLLRNATDPKTEDRFRHVLIDSRSGLADVGGLCLRGLPDTRVVLSGLNKQNLEGTRMVLNTLSREERADDELIVVFSPVPEGEAGLVDERIATAKDTLTFRDPDGEDRVSEEQIQLLHYHPRIALEETPFTESFHRRTRIYDEYETLTDDLLALTGSDARSLVSDALDRFREDDEETVEEPSGNGQNRYDQLAAELIPAAFLDEDHVESVVDGLCSQMRRSGPYVLDATGLFDLWVALSPDEFRVLASAVNFYGEVENEISSSESENAKSLLWRSVDLDERISEMKPEEEKTWYNWGTHLGRLAQLLYGGNPDRAESLYLEAFEKYRKAVEIKSDKHEAWHNWGVHLANLAHLLQDKNPDRAENLYQKAFEKYQEAIKVEPDDHKAWYNWGTDLADLAQLLYGDNSDRAESLYLEAFEKYREAVEIKPDKHEAWHNWGTDLANVAHLLQDKNPDRAENLYQKAFEKYQEAIKVEPDDHKAWLGWGIHLIRLSRLLRSQNQSEQAHEALSGAIEKLQESLSHGGAESALSWLIVALAERNQKGDVQEAADRLTTLLSETPSFVVEFYDEDAAAVRNHPELREILVTYREQVDEDELEAANAPDELDTPGLSE
jgi:tetratricopeptide (TPR) repeat protein/cellulose biosynthesis protein BcsQ